MDRVDPDETRREVLRHLFDELVVAAGIMPAVEPVAMIDDPSARCGIDTATAFITPTKSTSVASTKSLASGSPNAMGRMPALATTISRWPKSERPASMAARS
ncbi:hypothetical protein MPRS_14590 [Mycobacterium paraseoulense]|nr:hypothetical protein MPRS_14590 [Mycobacterium paraseoulense]